MNRLEQLRRVIGVSVVLGSLFGIGDLGRVIALNLEYARDAAIVGLWVIKALALGMGFALAVTLPLTFILLGALRGEPSEKRTRRFAAAAWIFVHVFLILLWYDYKSLEHELSATRLIAKVAFVAIAALAAWGLSGVAARLAGRVLGMLRPRAMAALLLVAAALFLGANWRAGRARGPAKQAEGPNVLFILVDTLRADALSCYGSARPTSPRIDAFAREGVLFREAMAESSWTIPTVASIFTGVYPDVHRVTNYEAVLSGEFHTLAEVFQAAGYRTGARISNILIKEPNGYLQGFDDAYVVMNLYKRLFLEKLLAQARITRHYYFAAANEISDAGLSWLERHGDERFYLYLHYYDPHYPYYPPKDYALRYVEPAMAKQFPYHAFVGNALWNMVSEFKTGDRKSPEDVAYVKAVYDAEVNFADDQIARVLDYLEEAGLADDTIVIFTADHGEAFYEHGARMHSKTLYSEEIHVPLIIKAPGFAPRVVEDPVRGLDIYRTLIELAGLPSGPSREGMAREIEAQAMGVSLVPHMRGESLPSSAGRTIYSSLDIDSVIKKAYLEDDWKLIRNIAQGDDIERPPMELYHLAEDPGERNDLSAGRPETRERLAANEARGRNAMADRAVTDLAMKPLDKDDVEKLKALGYINQ